MKDKRFSAFWRGCSLLGIILLSPLVTIRLITWRRIGNACKVLFLRRGNTQLLLYRYQAIYSSFPIAGLNLISHGLPNDAKDIVFFPPIDWGFRFQRPQHLVRELGKRGYRIFYLSTVPLIASSNKSYVVQDYPESGVVLIQLSSGNFRIPDFYRDELTKEEQEGFLHSYSILCRDFNISHPTLIIQQPFWWPIVSSINGRKVIYDCLDYHSGFNDQSSHRLIEFEQDVVASANEVVVTSRILADSFRDIRDCHLIQNGCEFNRFSQAIRSRPPSDPIIGYVGAVSEWFDGQLLFDVALERPNWQFDIYGATVGADIAGARSLRNINFLGEISYEDVPSAIAQFDVCIIPFKLNSLTLATNPVKMYEYLAVGRPVVATKMPELVNLESVDVFCSNNVKEFIRNIERAISIADLPDRIRVRRDWASQNDWSKRANRLIDLIDLE
jgi:glycosyltransferase involved in cell wall biosynthesis